MNSDKTKIILMVLIVTAGLVVPCEAASELLLSIEPDTTTEDVNAEFEIAFYVGEDLLDLMGYNVVFTYDTYYLDLVSVDEGSLPAGSGEETFFHCDSSSAGTVEVNGAVLGAVVQTPGTIFTVTFRGLESGKTEILIEDSDLRDEENVQLTHTVKGGVVNIIPLIDTEEYSWGSVKNIFR